MAKLICPNCDGTKWNRHVCKMPGCCWRVCTNCRLIMDILTRRAAMNSVDHPLFLQL